MRIMATSKRQVLIRVQPEDYKKLKAISIKNHRSVSNLLEWLMLNFINDYETNHGKISVEESTNQSVDSPIPSYQNGNNFGVVSGNFNASVAIK